MNKLIKNTDGISTIEYVILLMLIVAWRTFGNTVVGKVNAGNSQISGLGGT